jgi:putative tricarboxylic transport membrane protein
MVGAYGLGEVLARMEQGFVTPPMEADRKVETRLPRWREIRELKATIARSSLLGIICGIVPGAGATVGSFVAYGVEAQYGKRRDKLGTGIPEGIVAPQLASTATVGGHMVPLLALGIPGSGATAVILGAFLLHGVQPGPQIFQTSGDMVYTIFASMFAAVLGMCLLGYFAIKPLIWVLRLPEAVTSAFVALFCFVGAYSARNSLTDLWMIVVFGVVGYLFERFKFPIAPMVLGCILGPVAENSFMTSMIAYKNDWTILFMRPISGVVMAFTVLALLYPLIRHLRELVRARRLPPDIVELGRELRP